LSEALGAGLAVLLGSEQVATGTEVVADGADGLRALPGHRRAPGRGRAPRYPRPPAPLPRPPSARADRPGRRARPPRGSSMRTSAPWR